MPTFERCMLWHYILLVATFFSISRLSTDSWSSGFKPDEPDGGVSASFCHLLLTNQKNPYFFPAPLNQSKNRIYKAHTFLPAVLNQKTKQKNASTFLPFALYQSENHTYKSSTFSPNQKTTCTNHPRFCPLSQKTASTMHPYLCLLLLTNQKTALTSAAFPLGRKEEGRANGSALQEAVCMACVNNELNVQNLKKTTVRETPQLKLLRMQMFVRKVGRQL